MLPADIASHDTHAVDAIFRFDAMPCHDIAAAYYACYTPPCRYFATLPIFRRYACC